jgi:CPA1 family monovalent cation:H+ antiporter
MRGLVTLATAFALPNDFPSRDLIVLAAFFVVLGTLVLQGLTLKPLLRWLNIQADLSVEAEVSRARVAILKTAMDSLSRDRSPPARALRTEFAAARKVAENIENPQGATRYDELRLAAIGRQRDALHKLRTSGSIGDEAYHRLEEELDWAELDAAPAGHFQPLTT